ncbi:MAG: DUF4126 domain-containing protein [Verrucomicrobia bacterium]|nr:MAG: DUF4126 domain-containing protein [Verrucomicrobiota bacterium]
MDTILSICLGIGLSAACGFRVFVPLLCLSLAALSGHVQLANGFAWIGSYPALIAFAVATGLEIAAYYIPYVDNLMDALAIPAATVAGILLTASTVTGMDPMLKWTLAIIAGGGVAATTQVATTKLRALSTATTGGLANPVVSTAEAGSSTGLSIIALVWPILGFILVVLVLIASTFLIAYVGKKVYGLLKRTKPEPVVSAGTPA